MPLEFSNDLCAACESIAEIWHKGNDPIRRCPTAIIVVNVVDLQEVECHQLTSVSKLYTHSLSFMECVVASHKVMSACKKVCSAHVETPKVERFRKKGEHLEARRPHKVNACLVYFYKVPPSTCLSWSLTSSSHPILVSVFSLLGHVPFSVSGLDPLGCWVCLAPTLFTPKE